MCDKYICVCVCVYCKIYKKDVLTNPRGKNIPNIPKPSFVPLTRWSPSHCEKNIRFFTQKTLITIPATPEDSYIKKEKKCTLPRQCTTRRSLYGARGDHSSPEWESTP